MRITKSLAFAVATSMAKATIGVKIELLKNEMADNADLLVRKSISDQVMKCFKHSPDYFKTASRCMFKSGGMKEVSVDMKTTVPSKSSWSDIFLIERDSYEFLLEKEVLLKELKKERDVLIATLESTLLSLITLKKVQDQFPEAIKYFPKYLEQKDAALSLPLQDIKDKLQKYSN